MKKNPDQRIVRYLLLPYVAGVEMDGSVYFNMYRLGKISAIIPCILSYLLDRWIYNLSMF